MTPLLFVIIIAAVFMLMLLWAPKKSPQAPTSFTPQVAWQASSPRQVAMGEDLRVFADGYKSYLTQVHRDEVLARVKAMMTTVDVPPTKAAK